jgi:predicted phage terminase large subunit-like protein
VDSLSTLDDYRKLARKLDKIDGHELTHLIRYLCRTDLFFLLWFGCGRRDMENQWLIDRCKEVQQNPNGYLDLWAREHYKSTIMTFGLNIQDILSSHGHDADSKWKGREVTIGIFSCTRPIAKGFLRQIKVELENNSLLKSHFPDVLWDIPQKEAQKWSEDDGLVVKRKNNPKEATVEAWGIIEGQPTSKHFLILDYDDLITLDHVRSPDMITKVLDSWEKSVFLGSEGGYRRYRGTRYHFNDAYGTMIKNGAAIPRIYPATHNGQADGDPVLHSRESLAEKRRSLGIYSFASQMLLDPKADTSMGFKREWVHYYKQSDGSGLNIYINVDPANSKKKTSDYTVMQVFGLGADQNYYLLDMVWDRLSLTERGDRLFHLHRKWRPLNTGYEHYGMQADIDYIKDRMSRENYHFAITELKGNVAKEDRIAKLIPLFEHGRIYLPHSLFKTDYEGKYQDLIEIFLSQEYDAFPVAIHDDMLDCMARIIDPDLGAIFPLSYEEEKPQRYQSKPYRGGSSWAA